MRDTATEIFSDLKDLIDKGITILHAENPAHLNFKRSRSNTQETVTQCSFTFFCPETATIRKMVPALGDIIGIRETAEPGVFSSNPWCPLLYKSMNAVDTEGLFQNEMLFRVRHPYIASQTIVAH